jgi:hypothetical protein
MDSSSQTLFFAVFTWDNFIWVVDKFRAVFTWDNFIWVVVTFAGVILAYLLDQRNGRIQQKKEEDKRMLRAYDAMLAQINHHQAIFTDTRCGLSQ